MARGGYRAGAGRPKGSGGAHPYASNQLREKIKTNQILKRLDDFIHARIDMPSHAVTAALGLLRKVIPDLASVEHSGSVELRRAAELNDDELATIAASRRDRTSQTQDDTPQLH